MLTNRSESGFLRRLGFDRALTDRLATAQRAFIIGMGPSLRKFDLAALDGELIFGVNHAGSAHVRHDLLFIADDRRVTHQIQAGGTPIITIDACINGHEKFFANTQHYADIQAVHYGKKIPAILDVDRYPDGLPVAYWTGSVVTDLVIPFAVECGIPEVICLGLDGVEGSFPITHSWGMDELTRQLQRTAVTTDAETLPTGELVAHLQEKVIRLASDRGTKVINATPGGITEAIPRTDPKAVLPAGAIKGALSSSRVDGDYVAIGTSVFKLRPAGATAVHLLHVIDISPRCSNRHLNGRLFNTEISFVGEPFYSLRDGEQYLTTRAGHDRFTLRRLTQSFNTTLSSFVPGMDMTSAEEYAHTIDGLAACVDKRAILGNRLALAYDVAGGVKTHG